MTWAQFVKRAHRLPGMVDRSSYGTPGLYVGKKFMARLREDNASVAIRCDLYSRDFLLQSDPAMFFLTEHYRDWPAILIRLSGALPQVVDEVLDGAWRMSAGKRAIAERDAKPKPKSKPKPKRKTR